MRMLWRYSNSQARQEMTINPEVKLMTFADVFGQSDQNVNIQF